LQQVYVHGYEIISISMPVYYFDSNIIVYTCKHKVWEMYFKNNCQRNSQCSVCLYSHSLLTCKRIACAEFRL